MTKSFRDMTTEELEAERTRLEEANNNASGWGAAVGARASQLKHITRELNFRAVAEGKKND